MRTDSTMVKERLDLRTSPLTASFAVKDIDRARDFYKGTLGLDVRDDRDMGILEIHGPGDETVLVYPKPDHKPAVFTVLNVTVRDLDATVDSLSAAKVPIEHYDGKDGPKTDARGIAGKAGEPRMAWFRDPDRNILSVMQVPGR